MRPFLVVLSAPSGGGKTTIARAILERRPEVGYSISATTRPQRSGEEEGVDYYFLSDDEFQERVDAGQFLEWAVYGGHRYGTLLSEVERVLALGRHVMLDIEVQGARMVRERLAKDVVSIFILPPSGDVLRDRLRGRQTDDDIVVGVRLGLAVEEVGEAVEYDYVVENGDLEQAVADVAGIIDAESQRTDRQRDLERRIQAIREDLEMDES